MKQVNRPADFPKENFINSFLGKEFEDAKKEAQEWEERTGNKITHYYEQIPLAKTSKTKSILVSYKRKEIENEKYERGTA